MSSYSVDLWLLDLQCGRHMEWLELVHIVQTTGINELFALAECHHTVPILV